MDDLFRFLLLRPADVAAPRDVKTLTPSFVAKGAPSDMARAAARAFVANMACCCLQTGYRFTPSHAPWPTRSDQARYRQRIWPPSLRRKPGRPLPIFGRQEIRGGRSAFGRFAGGDETSCPIP